MDIGGGCGFGFVFVRIIVLIVPWRIYGRLKWVRIIDWR